MENLTDLVKSGSLLPGSKLIWNRRSLREKHYVIVNADGTLTTADGKIHKTPSGAARHLNGNKPVDGWLVWKPEGKTDPIGRLRK